MFKLVEERTAWQKVQWGGLTEEGERVDHEIEMQFLLLQRDSYVELQRQAAELDRMDADEAGANVSTRLAKFGIRIIRDWKGVQEANGDPIKFSESALARFFNVAGTFEAFIRAYREAMSRAKDARAGN